MAATKPLTGRTALVTGGAKRIGRQLSFTLAEAGATVVIHYNRSRKEAEEVVNTVENTGAHAAMVQADLENSEEVETLLDRAADLVDPPDILINNASIFPQHRLEDVTEANLLKNLRINTISPMVLSQKLRAAGRGRDIINLLDTRLHDYDKENVSYHLSKRTLFSLTRMMALEFGPEIRVNAIAPGLILPPEGKDDAYLESLAHTNPLQRHGEPTDIARAMIFLLASPFITGQVIYVDGGRHLLGALYG